MNSQVRRWVGLVLAWVVVAGLWLAPLAAGAAPFGEDRGGPGGEGEGGGRQIHAAQVGPPLQWSAERAAGKANRAPDGPAAPDVLVLWNQPLSAVDWSIVLSQEFPDYPTYSAYLADDFVNSDPWSVHNIFVPGDGWNGFYTLFGATALHWMVYADCAGVPCGDPSGAGSPPAWSLTLAPTDPQVTITTGTSGYPSNTLLTLTTPFSLAPGHWWLVFYPTISFDYYGEYGRQPSDTTNGYVGQWINPGNGWGSGTTWMDWTTVATFTLPADIAFSLEGLAGLRVDSTGDGADADLTNGVCETAGGVCTLRAAIQQANYDGGGTIVFTGMAGVPTIQPGSELPALSAPITIDGTTAGGRWVELDGFLAGPEDAGLSVGDDCVIRGLVIHRFTMSGILVWGSNNLIEGNRIGTNAAGTTAMGNGYSGVDVDGLYSTAANNTIRNNLISGNSPNGIYIHAGGASSNVVEGNYVGTDVTGNSFLPNSGPGVEIEDSAGNRLGGTTLAQRNVVSGNFGDGIWVFGSSTGNVVQGNYVGTNAAGTVGLPNVGQGILVEASGNTIGGPAAKAGGACDPPCNLVSYNSDNGISINGDDNVVEGNFVGTDVFGTGSLGNLSWGIAVVGSNNTIGGLSGISGNVVAFNWVGVAILESTSTGNSILGNDIRANYDLGIDLEGDGVTANDLLDADTGANQFQNYPELFWVVTGPPSASTVISGVLNSTPLTSFGIEFFYSELPDLSGSGEGQHYLGSGGVSTDIGGWATFVVIVPTTIPAASFVTATATDPNGNTSEFSTWRVAIPETMIQIGPGVGGELIYTDTAVLSTTVEVPAGAVSETIILALQPMAAPTEPPVSGLRSGGETFNLSAYLGNDVLEGYEFLKPLTVTLRYTDTDVYGILESGLRLYYWDGSTWQDAADSCSPPSTYFLDTVNNVMQVAICHLTEWNIQGPDIFPWKVHLPLVLRGF